MSGADAVARVILLPAAGDTGILDYQIPETLRGTVHPGLRVLAPLGRRQAVGLVVETTATSAVPRLRDLVEVLDRAPVLDAATLALCQWLARYYLCNLAEAITAALPGSVRIELERVVSLADPTTRPVRLDARQTAVLQWLEEHGEERIEALTRRFGRDTVQVVTQLRRRGLLRVDQRLAGGGERLTRHQRFYRVAQVLAEDERERLRRRMPAQFVIYDYLVQHPLGRAPARELSGSFANVPAKLKALVRAGFVAVEHEEFYRPVLPTEAPIDRPVQLNQEQRTAVEALSRQQGFGTFLLWGVTGSGKTEVYLHTIATTLERGQTALVLVPEISLTHQVVDRVRARFGERVAVLHSGLSDGERWDEWRRIARGEVAIAVGARSAVFAPLPRLGLIVVDEEHDPSYKQEDGIRYHGRDVAVMRAKLSDCTVLLGSATPSMETFYNARLGRYELLRLSERVDDRPLPTVDIVDLRKAPSAGRALQLTPKLVAALEANFIAQQQSLIFLNRRGFAAFLQCHACGEALSCPNCSVTLTLHRRIAALRCHHCDYTIPPPKSCPQCGALDLAAWGAGTEQVEEALHQLLPRARIGRMDRDTTSRKGAQREILAAWERREFDVLVGTQMVTKGHDVPGVTLVGVLNADQSLSFPDFRAGERTFQLVAQVAGRAGRGTIPGRVIVQTFQPEHEALRCAVHHDFASFAEHELAQRRELLYPPFSRAVQLRCEGEDPLATERIAQQLRQAAERSASAAGVVLAGPAPAPIERKARRHRWQLLLRGADGAKVRELARRARDQVQPAARKADVTLITDVDPNSML